MKNLLLISFVLVLVFALSSCEEEMIYIPNNEEQIPVVNCFFEPDSAFKLYLGLTTEIFDDNSSTTIPNANVRIIAEGGSVIQLHKISDNIYISDSVAHRGIKYKLEIQTEDYGIITSESYIPSEVPVIDTAVYEDDGIFDDYIGYFLSTATLHIYDVLSIDNYYEISAVCSQNLDTSNPYFNTLNEIAVNDLYSEDPVISAENNIDRAESLFLLFSDKMFKDSDFFLNIRFWDSWLAYSDTIGTYADGDLIFILKNTSKDYFLYQKSLMLHKKEIASMGIEEFTNMLFVYKNTEIYSNIQGGVGIFAGYNEDCKYIIHNPPVNPLPL